MVIDLSLHVLENSSFIYVGHKLVALVDECAEELDAIRSYHSSDFP